jgi:hypothetical protein
VAPARDAFTARHWNGQLAVQVHPPANPAQPTVARQAAALFGNSVPAEEWGHLAGMPDGATIHVVPWEVEGRPAVRLEIHHPWLDGPALRIVYQDQAGRTAVYNEFMRVRDDAPDGVGTRILMHQVRAARTLGVAYVAADAEGSPFGTLNGYYTWARLGFNGEIPSSVRAKMPPTLRDALDLLDLMDRPGGAAWWKANGRTFYGVFELRDGSRSVKTLDDYTSGRGIAI